MKKEIDKILCTKSSFLLPELHGLFKRRIYKIKRTEKRKYFRGVLHRALQETDSSLKRNQTNQGSRDRKITKDGWKLQDSCSITLRMFCVKINRKTQRGGSPPPQMTGLIKTLEKQILNKK
jgi:hypothetical protein